MTLGQKIKSKREELGISQTDLAKKINISKQTLYKYENDIITNIPSSVIEALADKLYTTPEYFFGWKEQGVPYDELSDNVKAALDYIVRKDEIEKAMALYVKFDKADPKIQAAVEALLKNDN